MKTIVLRHCVAACAAITAIGGSGLAATATTAQESAQALDACRKSINRLGALMRHSETAGADGERRITFVVRSNAVDYQGVCDPGTGIVQNVERVTTGS